MEDFYRLLGAEILSAESYLEDAEGEGWTEEAIEFQKKYVQKLKEVQEMAKEIYYQD